ncbi:MAG: pseudouridine-5-phosphate glycosidase [Streptosporangiales bacterium]|nr:pseudouridine-5-phosphate glycosidase [Streptosporangiales bacterium]
MPITVSEEVREAVAAGAPAVALESTIFTHGLPRPRNLEVARAAEQQLRDAGVVPATIGVVDGTPTVGLTDAQIERLAGGDDAVKVSTRDLPIAAARKHNGGTTVAATSFLAHRAGIKVFATGGLGGVHHGASTTFDESADLVALAHTPVLVVSAGVKSILDIQATLERMETLNIPVVGYRTTSYPGFYVADSGHRVEYSVDGPAEAADLVTARDALGLDAAVLVANPVPADDQLDPAWHQQLVAEAWQAAEREQVVGHDITPFLLDHIQRATAGASLDVNVAVYRNNVAVGGAIAAALRAG